MIQIQAIQTIFQLEESVAKLSLYKLSQSECFLNFLQINIPLKTNYNNLNSFRIQKC